MRHGLNSCDLVIGDAVLEMQLHFGDFVMVQKAVKSACTTNRKRKNDDVPSSMDGLSALLALEKKPRKCSKTVTPLPTASGASTDAGDGDAWMQDMVTVPSSGEESEQYSEDSSELHCDLFGLNCSVHAA